MLRIHGNRESLLAALTNHWLDQQFLRYAGETMRASRVQAYCFSADRPGTGSGPGSTPAVLGD
jgi:hypothetical protein